ncbi:MAG: FecR domain-containing protein, partial [bacterium]
ERHREQELDRFIQQGFYAFTSDRNITDSVLAQLDSEGIYPEEKRIKVSMLQVRPIRLVWVSAIVIIGIGLAISFTRFYSQYTQQIIVQDIRGNGVTYRDPTMTSSQPVNPGKKIIPGTKLTTNKWCQAELRSHTGVQIWLNRGTILHLAMNTAYTLDIKKGEIYIQKPKFKKPFRIKTPVGIVEPIGTSFDIRVVEQDTTQIAVINGKVQISHTVGQTVIPATFQTSITTAQNTVPALEKIADERELLVWVAEYKAGTRQPLKSRRELAKETFDRGYQLFLAKQYYDALTTYQLVISYQPDWYLGYFGVAAVNNQLDQFTTAYQAAKIAYELDPTVHNVRYQLVISLNFMGRPQEALPYALQLVHDNPENHGDAVALGHIYQNLGRYQEAEYWYRKGLSEYPCEECIQEANEGLAYIAKKRAGLGE